MPLPLYGSGGRIALTSAAIWHTTWRSAPLMMISVCVGVSHLMPVGMSLTTGCEKPICRLSFWPCACARKPTPTSVSFFSKPLATPLTMLLTSARIVPLIALACTLASTGSNVTLPPSCLTRTWFDNARDSVPLLPLTVILSAVSCTSTPLGTSIGILATRDICVLLSGHVDQHFAADTGGARLVVGHHALGRGDDRHAEAVHHLRDRVTALVDTQARAADALDALDHRPAGVVLQRDLELVLAGIALDGEAVDVALVLQHLRDRHLQLGRRHRHHGLLDALRIADARQHVGDRVTHAHM